MLTNILKPTTICTNKWFFLVLLFLLPFLGFAQAPVANFSADVVAGCAPLVVRFTDLSTNAPTSFSWDLGNGTVSTVRNPATTYVNPGIYTITLTATNNSGSNTVTKTNYITIYAVPVIDFATTDTLGCEPLLSRFTNNTTPGSGTIAQYEWNFGDGGVSNTQNPTHYYTTAGVYGVFLKVTNSNGCNNILSKPQYIKVGAAVSADFNATVPTYCRFPVEVNFTNTTTGTDLTHLWNFGDGGTTTVANPLHSYNAAGNYSVRLITKNTEGCADTLTKTISLEAKLATFTGPASTCVGSVAIFTATSAPAPNSYLWRMGDGTTYSSSNVNHTYNSAGTYTVTLVNNFNGCVDSIQKQVSVFALPTVAFSASPTTACKGPLNVSFQDQSSGAVEWQWQFGDGGTSNLQNPTHTYTTNGVYNVRLTIKNSNGCTATLLKSELVKIVAPKAVVTNVPEAGCTPLSFTPAYTITQVDGIASYNWDFGDGFTSTASNPNHTYTTVGSFPLTLIITSNGGCKDTLKIPNAVSVGAGTSLDFTANPTEVCGTGAVNFTPITSGAFTSYTWNFGDNTTQNQQFASHRYKDTGSYTVTLAVNYGGCISSVTKQNFIKVSGTIAKFGITKDCSSTGKFQFTNESVQGQTYKWEFGDGNISTAVSPLHNYTSPGTFTVKLISTNGGCSDTATKAVSVWTTGLQVTSSTNVICKGGRAIITLEHPNPASVVNYHYNFTGNLADGFITTPSTPVGWDYPTAGNFGFIGYTTDVYGCRDTVRVPQFIRVNGPGANFGAAKKTGCSGTVFSFSDSSGTDGVNSINRWEFDYGDGTVQSYTAPPFSHVYTTAGTYNVKMKVTDQSGCSDSLLRTALITVSTGKANFSSVDSFTCQGKQVRFTNESIGTGLGYQWTFGDGSTSTLPNPIHQYTNTGVYSVKLIVVASAGCSDTLLKTNYVTVKNPTAKFGVSDTLVSCPPKQINYTDSSDYVQSWRWYFADGNISSLQNPVNVYFTPNSYRVKLVVTSPGGCKDSTYKTVVVNGPTGSITYTPLTGCAPTGVAFKATTTGATSFVWDFGDGNSLSTNDSLVSHTYTSRGRFLPTILLKDSRGCVVPYTGSDTMVIEKLTPKFGASNTAFCDSGTVHFTDSTVAVTSASHQWYFGDGAVSGVPNPVHKYAAPGNYTVKLIVRSLLGCVDSISYPNLIKVVSSPKPTIIADSLHCSGSVVFTGQLASDTSTISSWNWSFGNGQTATLQNPPAQNFSPGSYTNTLAVTNASGCVGTATKHIQVLPPPAILVTSDTSICFGTAIQLSASGGSTYRWQGSNLSCTACSNPIAAPSNNSKYLVTAKSAEGCEVKDSVFVRVVQPFTLVATQRYSACKDATIQLTASGAPNYLWSPATGLSAVNISNPRATVSGNQTYSVIGYDTAGCFADTALVSVEVVAPPTVELGPDLVIPVGNTHTFVPVVSSDVTAYLWSPAINLSCSTCPNPILNSRENTTYNLKVTNTTGCSATDSVRVIVTCGSSSVFIPNTFSPNGDGSNDVFYPRGKGIYNIQYLRIFNRWGQLVFDRKNLTVNDPASGWNGLINGKAADGGVYTYFMEVTCNNNQTLKYFGNLNLIQ